MGLGAAGSGGAVNVTPDTFAMASNAFAKALVMFAPLLFAGDERRQSPITATDLVFGLALSRDEHQKFLIASFIYLILRNKFRWRPLLKSV
jgi:hypothetical protein